MDSKKENYDSNKDMPIDDDKHAKKEMSLEDKILSEEELFPEDLYISNEQSDISDNEQEDNIEENVNLDDTDEDDIDFIISNDESIADNKYVSRKEKRKKKKELKKDKAFRKKRRKKRLLAIFIPIIGIVAVIGIFAAVKILPIYRNAKTEAYSVLSTTDDSSFVRAGNTTIYATDGSVIGELGNEKFTYVSISDIPEYITNGYIAHEDKNFVNHHGIDLKAIARAGISYIKNRGTITQGGSTITQQLVKNCLLSSEQTFSRKATEALIALQVERQYSKTQIMEYYCNYNYYGNGCYGVEGASQYYFGKSVKDLSLSESAMLVATSNAPSVCNPVADYDTTIEKRDNVLMDMLECEYITEEQYNTAIEDRPEILQVTQNKVNNTYLSSYALYCAVLDVMENNGFVFKHTYESWDDENEYNEAYSAAYTEALEEIYANGYTIYTSLDTDIQEKLQKAVDEGLSEFTERSEEGIYKLQGAAVCIDNQTGMVIAIVGGRETEGEYNRGYQSERQPGSSIKPILDYAPFFNEGDGIPSTIFTDQEVTVNGYTPTNSSSSFMGNLTVREALVRSINTIALQVFESTGQETAMSYLDKLGFTTLSYADMSAPAVSIGGFTNGVSVCDMARAYATLANDGQFSEDDCVIAMTDYMGNTVFSATGKTEEVYLEDTAFMVSDILQGSFFEEYGLASDVDTNGQFYAGKTGTTNNNYDAWFCGYSKYYTTAVWTGYDYPEDLGYYGADYPLDIWSSFMNEMHEGLDPIEFTPPETVGLVSSSGNIRSIDYTQNIYWSRPDGYDYYSVIQEERAKEAQEERDEKALEEQAEQAVKEFEDYQITTVEKAQGFDSAYTEVYNLVMQLKDSSVRSSLLERLAYKKNLLDGEVMDIWQELIEDSEEEELSRQYLENEKAAQDSYDSAYDTIRVARINLVNDYIIALGNCTYYTAHVDNLIAYGQQAVEKCKEYSNYQEILEKFNAAANRAKALPEYQAWSGDGIPAASSVDAGVNYESASQSSSDTQATESQTQSSQSSESTQNESDVPEVGGINETDTETN